MKEKIETAFNHIMAVTHKMYDFLPEKHGKHFGKMELE